MTSVLGARRATAGGRLAAGVAACLTVGIALAPAAAADPFSDGQWYATTFKLADNHTVADGSGVTVAVIDGVFSPKAPSLAGADVVLPTSTTCVAPDGAKSPVAAGVVANHATAMTAMIVGQGGGTAPVGVAPGAKVLGYTIGIGTTADPLALNCLDAVGGTEQGDDVTADAITDAVAKGARIINMSFGGRGAQPATQTAILFAERKGVVFVGSTDDADVAGGQTRVIPPGSFNGVVLVNGVDRNGAIAPKSATGNPDGPLVVATAPGRELSLGAYTSGGQWDPALYSNGSSPATAFVTGALAATLSKYPDATGNQLVQSLARNTGGEEHDLDARALDGYGYGVVSLTSMLQHDPTAYPDENPTLRDGAVPSTAEISQGASGSASSEAPTTAQPGTGSASAPPASPPRAADTDGDGVSTGLIIGIGAGVLVLVVVVVLVLVALSRRGRRGGPPPGAPGPPPPVASGYR